MREDELQLLAVPQEQFRAGLRADRDPVQPQRRADRAVCLDGDLEPFIRGYLRMRREGNFPTEPVEDELAS